MKKMEMDVRTLKPAADSALKPRGLRPGDGIALIAPASVAEPARIAAAEERLQARGYHVKTYRDLQARRGYLAGDDACRSQELLAALNDHEIQAVFPVRGGNGATRIVSSIAVEQLPTEPKIFVGFSDITALHLALQLRVGWVTFHGPHPADGIGRADTWPPISEESFWRALEATAIFPAEGRSVIPPGCKSSPWEVRRPGVAEGRLVGGNLSLLCALMGTPFEINTDGCLLFLEDVDEQPYRIDRFLAQLKLGGKLDRIAGVILGQFTHCNAPLEKPSLSLSTIFDDYFGHMTVPVISNFPSGHVPENVTLPLNIRMRLDATRQELIQLEPAVT